MAKNVPAQQDTPKGGPVVSFDNEFEGVAGAGFENVGANDVLVPRLTILQALSPQLKRNKPEFIPEAKAGDMCDVASGKLFPDGLLFLPVSYNKVYLEWAPRESNKGLVAIHQTAEILEQCKRDDKNRPYTKEGNLVQETAQFFGFNLSDNAQRCFIAMAATQLKRARKWMHLATSEKLRRADGSTFTPPFFYRSYKLTAGEESNNQGDWFTWLIERSHSLPEVPAALGWKIDWHSIKNDAIEFSKSIAAGTVRADVETGNAGPEGGHDTGEEM